MSKLVTKGFTEVDGKVVEVVILSYDNNKRARVRNSDGTEESVHRGYIFADAKLTRAIPDVNWFVHGGGRRENFKPRKRSKRLVTYRVYPPGGRNCVVEEVSRKLDKPREFRNKADAVAYGSRIARAAEDFVDVTTNTCSGGSNNRKLGWVELLCYPSGDVLQYGARLRRPQGDVSKYLRGYGKRFD
jgi:hypothetical protein